MLGGAVGFYFLFVSSGLFVGAIEQISSNRSTLKWLFEATHNTLTRAALYSPFVGGIYQTFGFHQELHKPPPLIYLSDGGHLENLGLKQLLIRKCSHIIVTDAGEDKKYRCKELTSLLKNAKVVYYRWRQVQKLPQDSDPLTETDDEIPDLRNEDSDEKEKGESHLLQDKGFFVRVMVKTSYWQRTLRKDIRDQQVVSLKVFYPRKVGKPRRFVWIHYLKTSLPQSLTPEVREKVRLPCLPTHTQLSMIPPTEFRTWMLLWVHK